MLIYYLFFAVWDFSILTASANFQLDFPSEHTIFNSFLLDFTSGEVVPSFLYSDPFIPPPLILNTR